jgi:hypothetical protein
VLFFSKYLKTPVVTEPEEKREDSSR